MQLEEQNQAVVVSENAPQADSTPIKKQHGGKRAGAGRKPNLVKRTCLAMNLDIDREDRPDWLKVTNRAYSQAEGRHALLSRTRKL